MMISDARRPPASATSLHRPIDHVQMRQLLRCILSWARWETMFSTTTTAASTSMPMAIASPPRLIRLADMPNCCIRMKVISAASGSVSATTDGGAQIAEKQQQQDHHQHDGFHQRLGDRADGALHQLPRS